MEKISFIIITYNRPVDCLELLQDICQMDDVDSLLKDVVIVNNASTTSYQTVKSFIDSRNDIPFQYIDASSNLGVAQGRNFATKFARGEIFVFLDDDIVISDRRLLSAIVKAFNPEMPGDRPVGVVSFKVLYHSTGEMQVTAFPHKDFAKYKDSASFLTYYFVGCAHAMKKSVWEKAGIYPPDFFYGMEEYDLSFRILDAGYAILYDSTVVLLHKESPLGRRAKAERIKMFWVNKSKVAWKYLPLKYYCSTVLLWSGEYLIKTSFSLKYFYEGWKEIFSIRNTQKRTPISATTISYLKKVKARIWY